MLARPEHAFDADNHYYEAEDAFIRHVDPKMRSRCMRWAEVDGKARLLVGGKINRFIPNPTFDPCARPGALNDLFRGKATITDLPEPTARGNGSNPCQSMHPYTASGSSNARRSGRRPSPCR